MRIAIIEAGDTYTERRGTIAADLTGTQAEQIEQAAAIVAERGYRVMPDEEGGCCEYCQEIDAYGNVQESIAITVYPEEETTMQELFGAHTIAALDASPEARRRLRQAKDIIARRNMGARQQDALMLCTILRAILDNPGAFAAFAGEMYERRPGARA